MRLADQRPEVILGIDVGTQSAKCVVLDANGSLRGVGQEGYGVLSPRPQWFEQDPAAWKTTKARYALAENSNQKAFACAGQTA